MKKEIFLSLALIALVSCKKDRIEAVKNATGLSFQSLYQGTKSYDAHFYVYTDRYSTNSDIVCFTGNSKSTSGYQSDLGVLTLSGISISENLDFVNASNSASYHLCHLDNSYLSDGQILTVSTSGNSEYDSISMQLDAVQIIELFSPSHKQIVSNTENIVVEWNEQSSNTNPVAIYVSLLQEETDSRYSSSNPNYIDKIILTEDDGSYTISPSELSSFPQDAVLKIYVSRGSYTEFTTATGKECLFSTYSIDWSTVYRE